MTDDFSQGMAQAIDLDSGNWHNVERPGYLGRRRDERHTLWNAQYGVGNWRLAWRYKTVMYTFEDACVRFYEESYFQYLKDRNDDLDFICSFTECMDNAPSNIHSRFDYKIQEAYSTHIQDIAVRNVLRRLGRTFTGEQNELLIIRSIDSNGHRFGPGHVPFMDPDAIIAPTKVPKWASVRSTEDFWQSNRYLQIRDGISG